MTSEPILAAAAAYHRRGWVPVRITRGGKAPPDAGWQTATLDTFEVSRFAGHDVGVLLGEPSGDLVDVDLDAAEARALADRILPPTPCTFGRSSSPAAHRLYVSRGMTTTRLRDPDRQRPGGEVLLELRSTGAQTVFPPSIHPEGEPITWTTPAAAQLEPPTVGRHELARAVSELAAAALLARACAPQGLRHESMLALAGGLLLAGWTAERAAAWIEAVARAAGHTNPSDRRDGVHATARRLSAGENVAGWPSLAQLIGDPAVNAVRRWLGITTTRTTATRPTPTPGEVEQGGERGPQSTPAGVVEHVQVSALPQRHPRMLWAGRVPMNRVVELIGPGGVGKSTLACLLAAQLTRGTLPGELYGRPITVFWYTTEEVVEEELALRLDVAGADLRRVYVRRVTADGVSVVGGGLVIPDELSAIEAELRARGPTATVLDPLNGMLPADIDAHNAASVRRVMTALQGLCQRVDTTILGLGHLNKGDGGDLASRQAGSAAFRDAARCVLMLGRDPDDPDGRRGRRRVLVFDKANLTEEAPAITYTIELLAVEREGREGDITRMVETGSCDLTARDLLAAPGRDRTGLLPAENIIEDAIRRELIDSAPHRRNDVLLAVRVITKISERTVRDHATAMIARGEIIQTGGHKGRPSMWRLTPAIPGVLDPEDEGG